MRILIKGGHVIDPANDIDKVQDLYIADGKILARGRKPQDFEADRVIDAAGLVVCPGLVDMRARLREPGQENKATIASETKAAVKGGVTTLCCPPDTDPVIDTPAVVELIHRRALEAGFAKVVPLGALTYRLRGEHFRQLFAPQAIRRSQDITPCHGIRRQPGADGVHTPRRLGPKPKRLCP